MHGDCEHLLFVRALTDPDAAQEMENVPVIRKKGRKRKACHEEVSKSARAKERTQERALAAMSRGQEITPLRPHTIVHALKGMKQDVK